MHFWTLIVVLSGWWIFGIPRAPQSAPPQAADDAAVQIDEKKEPITAEELLELLERDGDALEDFRGRIRMEKIDAILQEVEWNVGEVFFNFDHEKDVKRFAVNFSRKGTDRTARDRNEQFIFDGQWLVEKQVEQNRKQFIARRVVPPGETMDALKLGEGPIPLPIAQKKDDVLARFEVEMIGRPEGDFLLAKTLANADLYGLKLTPKPGFEEADEFTSVRIWFDKTTLLPVGVDAEGSEARTIVWLWEIQRNIGLDAGLFDTTPPGTDDGWDVEIREWEG